MTTLQSDLSDVASASRLLVNLNREDIDLILRDLANAIPGATARILAANQKDLARMSKEDPRYDRLLLDATRLEAIASDIRSIAELDSPLDRVLEERILPQGMHLSKVTVPLGVVGIVYEARPNVTFDVFSLCFKAGNAVVLKGGSDAADSNKAIIDLIHQVLKRHNLDPRIAYLMPASRESVKDILEATDVIDVIIPRGSKKLIDYVREHARVPVIETGAGIVHTYIDEEVDLQMAADVINNAKTRRVSVCNALDTLIVHRAQLSALPSLIKKLADSQVEILADKSSYAAIKDSYPGNLLKQASDSDFGVEFLAYRMAIKTVDNLDQAINHISTYSSKHSEAILSSNPENTNHFLKNVDAAVVYANASTAFTDGAQFGMGAEIGISTQKLHARGPMALPELTSYKWIVRGSGQIREP